MYDPDLNQQQLLALYEKIASFTVGIAVAHNTEIGTGTLVKDGTTHFILTAEHVVGDADPSTIRFWSRPTTALVHKSAKDVSDLELKALTPGERLPIQSVYVDKKRDLAVMTLEPDYNLLRSSQFYDLSASRSISPVNLDGLSLLCFGFPTANAREIGKTMQGASINFVGCAGHVCDYDANLNMMVWRRLSSSISPEENFVFSYDGIGEGINPHGFSGCGVWIPEASAERTVWTPEATLIGVVHRYVASLSILIATNLPAVLDVINASNNRKQ